MFTYYSKINISQNSYAAQLTSVRNNNAKHSFSIISVNTERVMLSKPNNSPLYLIQSRWKYNSLSKSDQGHMEQGVGQDRGQSTNQRNQRFS